jgi:hypothetical protein
VLSSLLISASDDADTQQEPFSTGLP